MGMIDQPKSRGASRLLCGRSFVQIALTFVVWSLCASLAWAQSPKELRPQGYINDFARVLSPDSKRAIGDVCAELDKKANAQIAVVTVRSLEGETIDQYSIDLATRWGIGPKQKDRGVMILLAPREHRYRIEVGYGLEPILPDGLVGDIGRDAVPQLRIGNYSGAALLMTERVAAVIAKDRGVTLDSLSNALPNPMGAVTPPPPLTPENIFVRLMPILLLLIFPLLGLLMRLRATRRGGRAHSMWWLGPWFWGGGGFGGGFGGGSWGGGGFGGGGGGFGGFGGGSFGGGGASGSW
jgi:uncharacterized protein